MKIIRNQLPPPTQGYVAIDSEWWALNPKTLHRPTSGRFACLTIATSPEDVYWISNPQMVEPALQRVNDAVWLMHNGKFDFTHLRRLCKVPDRNKFIDTMLMERILWNGYYDRFAEDDLVRRYLSQYMDKTLQKSFSDDLGEMSEAQIEYSCLDVNLLLKVWQEQKKHITNKDMMVWKTVDQPVLWAVLDMMGFRLDVKKWEELAVHHKQMSMDIDASLPFNPRSWQQVRKALSNTGFKGLPDTEEKTITKWLKKYPNTEAAKLALLMLESRGYGRRASNYGMNFIDNYLEDGDLIFSNWNVTEAKTSRMCISGDTPLHTNKGIVNIDSLDLTSNGLCSIMTHKGRWMPITNRWYKGKEEMFLVTLSNGSSIKCTANHRFLCADGWKKLNELTAGSYLLTPGSSRRWERKKDNSNEGGIYKALCGIWSIFTRCISKIWHPSFQIGVINKILSRLLYR